MKTYAKVILPFSVIAILMAGVAGYQELQSQERNNVRTFMRAKLMHSQDVVEGLTTEDFDMIRKSAGQMEVLSQEAEWQVFNTQEYRQQSLEFRRAAGQLRQNAENKNLDAAALSYVDLTLKCVKCHNYVREVRNASTIDGL